MFFDSQILIFSWYSVLLFATGTFLWIIPVQIINGLKLIPIQRRMKRILFPYILTIIQISAFVLYVIGLNNLIKGLTFTNFGLIAFVIVILLYTKLLKDKIARYNEEFLRRQQENELDKVK